MSETSDGRMDGETWLAVPSGGALIEMFWDMWRKNGQRCSNGKATTQELRSSKTTPGERIFPLR